MNFEDKLSSLLHSLTIKKTPPNKLQDYLLLDYIEFYTFFYGDGVSKNEMVDYLEDNAIHLENFFCSDDDEPNNKDEADNNKETIINNLFRCLEYRENLLGNSYPFSLHKNLIELEKNLSIHQKLYVMLLFCSMLERFQEFQSVLTCEFEGVVGCALEQMYPQSIVKYMGKKSDYSGSAQEKIRALAADLKIIVREPEIKKVRGNQERGLDLIVWQPFKDKVPNMSISFVQCACGKNWSSKFDDSRTYQSYFDCYQAVVSYIFASSYALLCDDEFSQSDEIVKSNSIFLDRLRIINLVDEHSVTDKAKVSLRLVDELFLYTLDF